MDNNDRYIAASNIFAAIINAYSPIIQSGNKVDQTMIQTFEKALDEFEHKMRERLPTHQGTWQSILKELDENERNR